MFQVVLLSWVLIDIGFLISFWKCYRDICLLQKNVAFVFNLYISLYKQMDVRSWF